MIVREQPADVRTEGMRLLLKQLPVALVVNVANASLVALVFARVHPIEHVALWWLAIIATVSARALLWRRLARREPPTPENLHLWERRSFGGALVSGVLWGTAAFFLFPPEAVHQLFLAFVIGGMAAGAAAALSYHLPTYFGYVLPSVLPLAARFLVEGTPLDIVMGAMVVIFAVAVSFFALNQHAVLTRALRLQFDKSRLAAELADLLENVERRVQERTRELQTEIAERQRAEEAEHHARAEAEQANLAKSVFLAAASHDLRQPFQVLGLDLELLQRELTTETQKSRARRLATTLEGARELLDTLMDLSALETGKVEPAIGECRVQGLIDRIADEYRVAVERQGLRLRVHACPGATAATDPVLFARMLRNLVANALRQTTQGAILIACRRRRDHLRVEVWDTGPGIAQEKLNDIFEAFYRITRREQVLDRGLGLGLWIVARTAQLLGHEIAVRSRLGRGSVFSIKVPRAAAKSTAPR